MSFRILLLLGFCFFLTLDSCKKTTPTPSHPSTSTSPTPTESTQLATGFPEGFEEGSKGTYAASTETFKSGKWYLEDALVGTSESDQKISAKSVRIRNTGILRMEFDVARAEYIKIAHGAYGSEGNSSWSLHYSLDAGKNWKKIDTYTTKGNVLQSETIKLNLVSSVRFMIQKETGDFRLNIDEIAIYISGGTSTIPSRDDNVALGNPSNASTQEENYLMTQNQYILSYARSKGIPNWVSWHLSQAWKGDAVRQNNFSSDPSLPSGWYKVITSDYTNSGFDRGHLCPSDDRDGSQSDNNATFYMTNIMPQAPNNNRGPWQVFESYCRTIAAAGNELYIISGGWEQGGTGSHGGITKTLADGKINVPKYTWKVVLILPNGQDDVNRVKADTRVIAIKMPNTDFVSNTSWGSYRVSIDELETLTSYNFFSKVPINIQNSIESKIDDVPISRIEVFDVQ